MKKRNTKLMRVPDEFYSLTKNLSKKRQVSCTEFLKTEGLRIIKNADVLTDLVSDVFWRKRK